MKVSEVPHKVERWFKKSARQLAWRSRDAAGADRKRGALRAPYPAFVAEAMLQQTQVSRVLEKFEPFLERFPTAEALASAPEQDVLAAWSGLGYYRRARNLHAAAKQIVDEFGGVVPSDVHDLMQLKGVGRYTAGAIASIVFGQAEPIVDGNVRRVLVRMHGRDVDESPAELESWAWEKAQDLVEKANEPALFNEGLMELGALICTPKAPKCMFCPVAKQCQAQAQGLQEDLPKPKPKAKLKTVYHAMVLITDSKGRCRVEERSSTGLWAGMWQPLTVEAEADHPSATDIQAQLGLAGVVQLDTFTHITTHRRVEFSLWEADVPKGSRLSRGQWLSKKQIAALPLANPHRRVLVGDEVA